LRSKGVKARVRVVSVAEIEKISGGSRGKTSGTDREWQAINDGSGKRGHAGEVKR